MRYQIPLDAGAQKFSINIGDYQYEMTFTYRDGKRPGWVLDVERSDGEMSIYGIPLICGVDLFEQYGHKKIGHLRCMLDGGDDRVPTYEDMGSKIVLIWSDDE